jgi:hypothetical protein
MQPRDLFAWAVIPCLVMFYVSYAYFKADRSDASLRVRLATAGHGASAAILYLSALLISAVTHPRLDIASVLFVLYVLPAVLTVFSLASYRGPKRMHALQFLNVPVMLITAFVGLILVAVREI